MTIAMRVTTAGGSTYLVGPSARENYVRVARVSDHVVAGTDGPVSFAEDYVEVEVVSDGQHLRLRCTHESGSRFRTSPIVEVVHQSLNPAPA